MTTTESTEIRREHANAVIDRAMEMLLAHDMTGFAHLWAPHGTIEFPFAGPGQPARLDGRAAVADYLDGYTDTFDIRGITAQTRHQTLDPDTVVVEFEAAGVVVASQNPYSMRYVAVITVRADGIASYRDYWNPRAVDAALGIDAEREGPSW